MIPLSLQKPNWCLLILSPISRSWVSLDAKILFNILSLTGNRSVLNYRFLVWGWLPFANTFFWRHLFNMSTHSSLSPSNSGCSPEAGDIYSLLLTTSASSLAVIMFYSLLSCRWLRLTCKQSYLPFLFFPQFLLECWLSSSYTSFYGTCFKGLPVLLFLLPFLSLTGSRSSCALLAGPGLP